MSLLQCPDSLPDLGTRPTGSGLPIAHRAWLRARDQALAAVRAGDGLVLVLGPPGTGKSLLLQDLARLLGSSEYDVLFQLRGDVPVEAGDAVAGDRKRLLPRVALIDEADRITEVALKRLGQLGAVSLVFAGLTGPAGGFGHRPATVVRLAPLAPDEVGAFAAERLARAGRQATPLADQAVQRLAERSGGVPRVVTMLADAAAFLAALDGAARIEASHVDQAAAMRGDDKGPDTPQPEAEPDGTMQPQAAEGVRGAPPPARQAAGHPLGPAHSTPSSIERVAVMQGGMVPNAPPLRAAEKDVIHPAADVDERAAPVPARRATERRLAWGYGAALSAASGIAAVCGWLALQPGLPARHVQPLPEKPATAPALPGNAGQGASSDEEQGTTPALPDPAGAAERAEEGSSPAAVLPAGVPGHVVIYYARNDAGAEARAAGLARTLRAAGMVADDPVAIPRRTRVPGVRYFFAEDRGTAGEVLGWTGLPPGDLRAGAAQPGALPRPGMIEVTMPPS